MSYSPKKAVSVKNWLRQKQIAIGLLLGFLILLLANDTAIRKEFGRTGTVTVEVTPGHPANTFLPNQVLGAGLDGLEEGDVARLYTSENIRQKPDNKLSFLQDKVDVFQYSSKQDVWHAQGQNGYPLRSKPPEHFTLQGKSETQLALPAYSLTVVRGMNPNLPSE